ncbi:phosphoribosyltransferase family protein [Streptomyces sp. DSM 44917]|uniref:Phosphoribosyltransferase family protein n=1 Tax=Streptomyces boetiae TaxID=3075541 RepID=A0ABU2L848_9ACTN|nr:phosphoribosyltransferase family protein [Streptomyces sp. DSM 44917]MDT0307646.1 phosphoribosyltransferase family protein [Streptomyces sp. DSM 44917]
MTGHAQRVFEHRRIWLLTEEAFAGAAELIAEAGAAHRPQAVMGIARGGTRLAEAVATHLSVPAAVIRARHNVGDDPRVAATGRVRIEPPTAGPLARLGRGRRLLLVDDISGSGATLRAVIAWLTRQSAPAALRTAVLCRNQGSAFTPDAWGWEVADWVSFPWEPPPPCPAEALPPLTGLCHPDTARRG